MKFEITAPKVFRDFREYKLNIFKKFDGNLVFYMPYILALMLIITTSLLGYFAVKEYRINYENIQEKLATDAKKIEEDLVGTLEHTAFLMKLMALQIKPHYKDLRYISSVLNKSSITANIKSTFSWTIFSWVNSDDVRVVDTISGTKARHSKQGHRGNIQKAKLEPYKLHTGSPIFGFSSQRHLLPASTGIVDGNKYLGSLTVGFDILSLSAKIEKAIEDPDVYFAILDEDLDIIVQSQTAKTEYHEHTLNPKSLEDIIEQNHISFSTLNTFSKLDLLISGENYYIHRIPNYPFAIYLQYDNKLITRDFWKDVTFRVVEVLGFAFAATLLVLIIYRREKYLREKAEYASKIALDASQAKTDFLAYTAHELRSPLSFIISASEILSTEIFGKVNEKHEDYIKSINQSGKDLLEFLEDLLDNMKVGHDNFRVEEKIVDTLAVLSRAIKINNLIYNNKISIDAVLQKNLPLIKTDQKRLLQIFSNIISNAIKYSAEGTTLTITVNATREKLTVLFKDQGYGMTDQDLKMSMKKEGFNSGIKRENHVGLGLPLVLDLTNAIGGIFTISSTIGVGTEVKIEFNKEKFSNAL